VADGQINFFLDAVDDPLLPDQIPSFEGGQFSNLRANLLQPNQSKLLGNCDIDKLGKLRTRRGTILIGTGPPSGTAGTIIQGLTSFQTKDYNYIVAANDRKIWKWTGSAWEQIATGGVSDNDEMLIYREGKINMAAGYTAGETVLTVDDVGYVGAVPPVAGGGTVAAGEKLYFLNNLRTDYYEYTIASVSPAAPAPTTTITLEEPGLVFNVKDNWKFSVSRPARINNAAGYPGGYTGTLAIDEYDGVVNPNEDFIIKSENKRHNITSATGSPTTAITAYTGALQADYLAANNVVPIVFAQGNDLLFFSDGVGAIYGWNGKNLMNLSTLSALDYQTGSALHRANTAPPTAAKVLLWFQNRLIASGIAAEPDAIYFSDFFDPTSWDRNYQLVRIGGGESDPITGCLAWTDLNMLVFKKNSIYVINLDPTQNPNPDDPTLLVASFAVKQLHKKIGCPAPLTAVQVGGGSTTPGSDVFFVDGDKKVHSVRRVMAAESQQEVGQAISLPVQDVLDTINLDHIDRACAMYHNEHYILSIPSARGAGGGVQPNAVLTYNLLTQSWCGVWSWAATSFAIRTDLGSYSKLIFGDYREYPAPTTGRVLQWLDDQSLDDETEESYQDFGNNLTTSILTRAITFGDHYSFKTGLNVEFEFDESVAGEVLVKVILDKIPHPTPIAVAFSSLSEPRLRLPVTLPFTLPLSPDLLRKAFDLQRYGTWRELQFQITTTAGKLAIRSIRVTGWMDTIRLQTIPMEGIPSIGVPPPTSSGGP
jgi:hypothetical protein